MKRQRQAVEVASRDPSVSSGTVAVPCLFRTGGR